MAGIGDSWGTREEMLHPRGKNGRFVTKLKTLASIVDAIQKIMGAFRPRTFQSDGQAAQYAHNIAKPSRFGGGTGLPRFKADFDNVQEDLRDGIIDEPSTKRYVAMMDSSAVDLPDDVILSRVVGPDAFGLTPDQMDADTGGIRDLQGSLIADRGYAPTTIGTPHPPPAGRGNVTMVMAVPKGTRAIPVGDGPNDREIILDRNQEFQVTKVTPDGRGGFYMYAVATPRTPGETPTPTAGHVGPGRPQNREAAIKARAETARKRLGVTPDLTRQEQQQPLAPGGMVPQAPPAGTPEAPAVRKARRQKLLAQGPEAAPPAPAAPAAPSPTPEASPAPTLAAPAQVDFRAAAREANLPAPTGGKRRKEWNNAYQGVVSGKKHPEDVVRELDADIAENKRLLEQDRKDGTDSGPLPDDIRAQEQLRDLIKEKYGLGGQQPAPTPEPTPAPAKEAVKAVKKAAPKAPEAPKGHPRKVAEPVSKEGRVPVGRHGHATIPPKETGEPRKVAEPVSKEGRIPVGRGHATVPPKATGEPRKVAEPVSRKGREEIGQGHFTPVKASKPEKVAVAKAVPSRTSAPTTKAAREEEQHQMDTLRETISKLPADAPTRAKSEKLLAQMEQDFQDDELVREWLGGSGVREPSLTEAERTHLGRVARDIREGKISNAEAAKDLRSQGSEKLDKIARRVEGGEKLKAARKPKTEPIDELDTQTVPELKKTAKAEGIKGYSKLNKDAIKKAIRDKRSGGGEAKTPTLSDMAKEVGIEGDAGGVITARQADLKDGVSPEEVAKRLRRDADALAAEPLDQGSSDPNLNRITRERRAENVQKLRDLADRLAPAKKETPAKKVAKKAAPEVAPAGPIKLSKLDVSELHSPFGRGVAKDAQRDLDKGDSPQEVADDLRRKAEELRGEQLGEDEMFNDRISHSESDVQDLQRSEANRLEQMAEALEAEAAKTPPIKKAVPAKKAAPRLAPSALTPEQKNQVSDLSPDEQKQYRIFRREGQSHDDALQSARDLVGTREAAKAGRAEKALARNAEAAARTRQQRIDKARSSADLAGELEQLVDDNASVSALRSRIKASAGRAGVDPQVREYLLSQAATGDRDAMRRAIDNLRAGSGIRVTGHRDVGEVVSYDPHTMEAIGKVKPGDQVRIVRPGHETTINGETVQLNRRVVRAVEAEPAPKKATVEDRVTAGLLDRMDPGARDAIMADMAPADRQLVREAVARAGGTPPPVTDAEVKTVRVEVPQDVHDAIQRATADDLREAAKAQGLDIPAGTSKDEVLQSITRDLVQKEMDKRVAAKAAKAAKKAPAPRPTGAYEGLDVEEIGKGLDLHLIPQGYLDGVQKDLDEGKLTPAAIGRELRDRAHGPMGPGHQLAVAHGVSGTMARDRLKAAQAMPPSPERDAEIARQEARIQEVDAEVAGLRRQMEEMDKLAERLKVTRRKRAIAPKPEEPTLTPKEEVKAAEVADLAGVPESKVQARIKAQKVEAAPASDHGQGIADLLKVSASPEEDEALLKGRTKRELQDILKAQGHTVRPSATKADLTRDILDTAALNRGSQAIREMIHETGMMSSKMTPAQIARRLTNYDFENPPSRAEAGMEIAGLSKVDLVEVAKQLGIPSPGSKTKDVLHGEIVEAAVGRRIDSIATRGFTGVRPGAPSRPLSELRAFQAPPSAPSAPAIAPQASPGTAAGKITTARLLPGTRITVRESDPITGNKLPNGTAAPTARKTGGIPARVVSTHTLSNGRRRVVVETDDGRRLEIPSVTGGQTFHLAPGQEVTSSKPVKKATAKAAPRFPVPEDKSLKRTPAPLGLSPSGGLARAETPVPAKAAAPSVTGPLQRKRPSFDAGHGEKPLERPNADQPLELDRFQMSGSGNMHADSEMGQLWDDLYRDDRTPNSTLNRISELARSMAFGDRSFDDILHELRQLEQGTSDPAVKARIERTIKGIDAPVVKAPALPEGTPASLREALQKLASIPTARKSGRVGYAQLDRSVLDTKVDVVRRLAAGELSAFDVRTELGKHDLHESVDGAVQMWDIFDRLIKDHGEEIRKWAQAARRKASG